MNGSGWGVTSGSWEGLRFVQVHGHVDSGDPFADSELLESQVREAAEGGEQGLVFDMSATWSIHPLPLGRLASVAKELGAAGRPVHWSGTRRSIFKLLKEIVPLDC